MNWAAGSAQNAYGQAVDEARNFASDQPVVALLSAMTLGILIGFLLGRRCRHASGSFELLRSRCA